jgi:Fic family protein
MIHDYLSLINLGIYPSRKDWFSRYGKHGKDADELLAYKKANLTQIPLKTKEGSLYYNEPYISAILKEYYETQDIGLESIKRFTTSFEEILIFSEVEGTLEIEGVKTSKKKIENILKKTTELDRDDQVVFNMKKGIDYISTHEISESHLHELYELLTFKSLDKDEVLEGGYYRKHDVDIIGKYGQVSDRGIEADKLSEWMTEFIRFIQDHMTSLNPLTYLMPHLIHYYMVLLHPYYDFNGRMGRMLGYWYILKCPYIQDKMPVFSEAINYNSKTKALYYKSIENAREEDNDLTYFFETMFVLGKKFVEVYLKLEELNVKVRKAGHLLTQNELNTLKSILLYISHKDHFTWEDVSFVDKEQYTKQYYLRLLNGLCEKTLVSKTITGKIAYFQLK